MRIPTDIEAAITRRITTVLFATTSLYSTALVAIFTVTPIIAVRMTGSDASAGVPTTVMALGRAAGAYPVGWMMDRLGRRLGLSAGFLAAIVGMATGALAVLQGAFWLFLGGAFFIGMSRSAVEQTRYIAAEVQPAGRRAKAIGLIVFSGAVGSLGSRLVMELNARLTAATGIANLAGPWLLAIGIMGLGLLLNQVLLRPDPLQIGRRLVARAAEQRKKASRKARPMRQIFRRPYVLLAAAVMALAQLSMVVVMVVTPLHMDYQGFSTLSISTALMLHTLGMFAFAALTGWLISWLGRVPVIWVGAAVLTGAGLVGFAAGTLLSIYAAVFLLGLGWNLCHIAGSALLSDELISQERGRAQGINEVVIGVTVAVGSLASGSIYGGYGYAGTNAVVLCIVAVLALAVLAARWAEARGTTVAPKLGGAPPG